MDDETFRRWMRLEGGMANSGLVVATGTIPQLRAMREPALPTRDGGVHAFDPAVLARLEAALPILLRHRLRLPITVWEPHDAPGDGYVEDATAIEALQALGLATTAPRGSRLWMSVPLWRQASGQWPGCFQTLSV